MVWSSLLLGRLRWPHPSLCSEHSYLRCTFGLGISFFCVLAVGSSVWNYQFLVVSQHCEVSSAVFHGASHSLRCSFISSLPVLDENRSFCLSSLFFPYYFTLSFPFFPPYFLSCLFPSIFPLSLSQAIPIPFIFFFMTVFLFCSFFVKNIVI